MHKHPLLIAILLAALVATGCVAGQPVSPEDMAAVAPTIAGMVSQIAPQLAGTYSVQASDGAGETRELSLRLAEDGSVELVTELADASQLLESGTWLLSGQGDVVVTLGGEGTSILEPRTIRLAVEGSDLVATDSVTGAQLRLSPGMIAASPSSEPATEAPAAEAPGVPAAEATAEPAASPEAVAAEAPAAEQPAAQDADALTRTFLSLQPAASSPALLRALAFAEDGTATLTSDYYEDEDLIVESGTWVDNGDGTLTVTLTGRGEQTYFQPIVITFALEDDVLTAVEYDEDLYGSAGLTMRLAADVAMDDRAALVALDLQAGFPLDPTFVSINAGGDLNSAVIAPECAGFINTQPVVTVDWTGETEFVEVFFVSNDDSTLVILAPDGQIYCNDDANDQLLDPVVELTNPIPGKYRIWAGSYARNQLIPGVLVLTTRPDMNIGTFDLGSFIQRPVLPEVQPLPTPAVALEEIQSDIEAQGVAEMLKIAPAGPIQITTEGVLAAFELPLDSAGCSGLVNDLPDHVFQWSGEEEALNIFFEGDEDASLLVLGPDGAVACTDDSADGANRNPQISLPGAAAGAYAVWVGRLNPEKPLSGALTVTADPAAAPVMLEPAQ